MNSAQKMTEKYDYPIETSKMFVELSKSLKEANIELSYETDSEYYREHKTLKFTDIPEVRTTWFCSENGKYDGFYFNKMGYDYFTIEEDEKIKRVFDKYPNVRLMCIDPPERGEDLWLESSISFIIF